MNRLVSILMLAGFAAQHFVCCCSGQGADVCDHGHSRLDPICAIAESLNDAECHCGHDHAAPTENSPAESEEHPSDGSHGHHICVASHVFFVLTPRAAVPPSYACQHYFLLPVDSSLFAMMVSSTSAVHDGVDSGTPFSAQARRSALGVYRI